MSGEAVEIDEGDLEDLLEETKGEVEVKEKPKEQELEAEIELEAESETKTVSEEPVLEVEEEIELDIEERPEVEQKKVIEPEIISAPETGQAIAVVKSQTGLVAPVCTVQQSVEIFKEFEKAKREILSGNDVLWIGGDGRPAIEGQGSPHIKRSGWRKLARFFGLSWDIERIEKLSMEHSGYMYKVRVKVWHPAGASVVSEGIATSRDGFFTKGGRQEAKEENIIMKAETVAINRAISDILGSGEVSGEETE